MRWLSLLLILENRTQGQKWRRDLVLEVKFNRGKRGQGEPTGAKVAEASEEGVGPTTRATRVRGHVEGVGVGGRMHIYRHSRESLYEPSVRRDEAD